MTDRAGQTLEAEFLPCASRDEASAGRLHAEGCGGSRPSFQRDCDRIVHTNAFRRLMHKTQVFFDPQGDHVRTRLTHTIEVARVSRSIASRLGLNANLAESIALAHDLGHAPFGHAGEEALSELMACHGGFDHNAQAIRIVTSLERSYIGFDGINLTWESLEGIAKHNGPVDEPVPYALSQYNAVHDLQLATWPSAEAQVAAVADDIAYNSHDLQDGIRARFLDPEEVFALPILKEAYQDTRKAWPAADRERIQFATLRQFFAAMTEDVIDASRDAIKEAGPKSSSEVRYLGRKLIGFSDGFARDLEEIRGFLNSQLYRKPSLMKARRDYAGILRDLFEFYISSPQKLPPPWVRQLDEKLSTERVVTDYLAGMTDKFALSLHRKVLAR